MRRRNSAGKFVDKADVDRVLGVVFRLAKEQKIPCCLVGGIAMAYLGSPRLTADVDVVALRVPDGLPRGKRLTFGGLGTTVEGVPVDVIVRDDGYVDLYEAAVISSRKGLARPAYLVAMKIAAHRPKDLEDVEFLISSGHLGDFRETRAVLKKYLNQLGVELFNETLIEVELKKRLSRRR